MTQTYLTRRQVAELYPISDHTLAALASKGLGPPFFKPTDKALYRPQDVEAWIEAAIVAPVGPANLSTDQRRQTITGKKGRGRAIPLPRPAGTLTEARGGRKSLPPSANSSLRRKD